MTAAGQPDPNGGLMRKFTVDKPEFFTFQIEGSDEVYNIPLASSMPMKHLVLIKDGFEGQVEMMRAYMGDIVDDLTAQTLSDIVNEWSTAQKDAGASVGES